MVVTGGLVVVVAFTVVVVDDVVVGGLVETSLVPATPPGAPVTKGIGCPEAQPRGTTSMALVAVR